MLGLMQDWPLTVDRILDHASLLARRSRGRHPLHRGADRPHHLRRRSTTAPSGFPTPCSALGVQPGDRVATLAWNTGRHIEAWYAIMGIGAVCHTLNPRLFAEQLCYIINHAEDKVLFTDLTFLPVLAEHRATTCPRSSG